MGGDKWENKAGWEVFDDLFDGETMEELEERNIDVCNGEWYGLLCRDGVPTRLSLPGNDLFGSVPKEVFEIPWTVFDLSNNNVQMEDFSIIENPKNLTSLIMSNAKITSLGGIGNLNNLEQLYLDGLDIKDNLPDSLFDLTALRTLHLQHGGFKGPLPTMIGKLTQLQS
jgi:hypothetical protein